MSITDLFVVGLGLDVAGAVLLAKGLLMSSAAISGLATWQGVGYGNTVERCRGRVDAKVGMAALGVGFMLQLIGYGATLAGARTATGPCEVLVAALLTAVAVSAVFLWWYATRDGELKGLLISVARQGASGTKGDGEGEVWTHQRVMHLAKLAKSAGWLPLGADRVEQGVDRFILRVYEIEVPRYLPEPELFD